MAKTSKTERPTDAEVAAWKKEHKEVYELETEDGTIAILRRPKLIDMERAMMADKKKGAKPLDFNRVIAKNCMLWCPENFWEDEDREMELLSYANELAAVGESRSRKL